MSKTLFNLLLITISSATYFIVISPLYYGGGSLFVVSPDKSIVQLLHFKSNNDAALTKLNTGLVDIENLKKEYNSTDQHSVDTINTMIPDSVDPIRLVSEITKIAKDMGLAVENISVSKEGDDKKLPGIGVYMVSFSTKCSYGNLKDLLSKLQSSMRLFSVQSVNFSTSDNPADPLTVNIKMKTYYIK